MTKIMRLFTCIFALFFLITLPSFAGDYKRIYLTSYPRSGSHWVRYLIEEVTNLATSSVYQDRDEPLHLPTPFPWGGYCPEFGYEGTRRYPQAGETVVIKTHYPLFKGQSFDLQEHEVSIRIVRHPVDSIYSHYIYYKRAKGPSLSTRLPSLIRSWKSFQEYWNKQENALTVRYEDLFTDPAATLVKIMQATGYPFTMEDIERAIKRYPPQGELKKHSVHFTEGELARINEELGDLMQQFHY